MTRSAEWLKERQPAGGNADCRDLQALRQREIRATSRIICANPAAVKIARIPFLEGTKQLPVCLGIKAHVHGRLQLCAYTQVLGGKARGKQLSWWRKESKPGPNKLVLCREVRRGLEIGNRWRNLPLETIYTSYGRNLTRDAAFILETRKEGLALFATLTVPTGTAEGFHAMSCGSGYAVDRLTRWLRERCIDGEYVYVWERQKRGSPHLHMLFRVPAFDRDNNFYTQLRAQWTKILHDMQVETGAPLLVADNVSCGEPGQASVHVHCKVVKYSFAAYISKYMSKGATKAGQQHFFRPGRWWGCSKELRHEVWARRTEAKIRVVPAITVENTLTEAVRVLQEIVPQELDSKLFQGGPWQVVSTFIKGMDATMLGQELVARLMGRWQVVVDWVHKSVYESPLLVPT